MQRSNIYLKHFRHSKVALRMGEDDISCRLFQDDIEAQPEPTLGKNPQELEMRCWLLGQQDAKVPAGAPSTLLLFV